MGSKYLKEALDSFFPPDLLTSITFFQAESGINNFVYYFIIQGKKYVIKIYNGNSLLRTTFEHEIIKTLQQYAISFEIPKPLAILNNSDCTLVTLSNNLVACVFSAVGGSMPHLKLAKQIGYAAGELSNTFACIDTNNVETHMQSFSEIFKAHHSINKKLFFQTIESSIFDLHRDLITFFIEEIIIFEEKIIQVAKLNLPKQLIHGDLQYENFLCDDEKVTAIVDFEDCTIDWRVMDFATCLSKYVGETDPLPYLSAFVDGYKQRATLTKDEIGNMTFFIELRVLTNIVYFVGRALCNEDSFETLFSKLSGYRNRLLWLHTNKEAVEHLLSEAFSV